jgi:4-hydroxybenzoate polyprenyltransferase
MTTSSWALIAAICVAALMWIRVAMLTERDAHENEVGFTFLLAVFISGSIMWALIIKGVLAWIG